MNQLRKHKGYNHPVWEGQIPPVESMGKKTAENGWTLPELNLRAIDASDMDLSGYDMQDVEFGEGTIWPKDISKCPQNFEKLEQISEFGKDPGLGVRALHKRGIDGTGMSIAIIDQLLSDHIEYHDNLVHYEEIGYDDPHRAGDMHGSAVSSIAVGKNCGVAPKSKLYYFACNNKKKDEAGKYIPDAEPAAQALEKILKINETLPEGEKIQVVSMSWGGQNKALNSDQWQTALEKAKKAGLFVLTCHSNREYELPYERTGRKATEDPNKNSSYIETAYPIMHSYETWLKEHKEEWIKNKGQAVFEKDLKWAKKIDSTTFYVPAGHRTLASPVGKDEYVHYYRGGASWTTPWVAGMFVLARQVNPNITPEHFWEIALKTSVFNEKVQGKIIQPEKLIDTLQKELKPKTLQTTLKKCMEKAPQKQTTSELVQTQFLLKDKKQK